MNKLDVYKASAGSGKTYTLTELYIKFLLESNNGGNEQFRHVLAVTFTNKATDEMKSRIVERLYEISKSDKPVKVADITLAPARAKELLSAILHNYSYFRITTIDKFFQNIIRAFVRELGMNSNYAIELDISQIVESTLNDILLKLGEDDYSIFRQWFLERILSDADEKAISLSGLRRELDRYSKEIFKEKFRGASNKLADSETLQSEEKRLRKLHHTILSTVKGKADDLYSALASTPDILKDAARGSFTAIINIANDKSDFPDISEALRAWCYGVNIQKSKQTHINEITKAWNSGLREKIVDFVTYVENNKVDYYTCDAILENISYVQLFKALATEINNHTRNENKQLLSNSGEFIKSIIDGSDTPFIYEKIGTVIENYLIDEFQDTSHIQWDNFVPLIQNSLADGHNNLVVGDIKQSIYRFRDSDWTIIGSDVEKRFRTYYSVQDLKTNYRSLGNIVDFNNRLFTRVARFVQNTYNLQTGLNDSTITDAYRDVCQQLPAPKNGVDKKGKGYVEISFYGAKDEFDLQATLLNDIEQLKAKGYRYNDIGVLVRTNSEAAEIATILLSNGINVISEEALLISSSTAVSNILSVLKLIANKDDFESDYIVKSYIEKWEDLDFAELAKLPLYEMVEQIIYQLQLTSDTSHLTYINAFKDLVMDYITKNGSNIKTFLEWWDDIKEKKNLTTLSESDSINVLTLHKSKGLSYKVVIMPFISWSLKPGTAKEILWEEIPVEAKAYKELQCVPVVFNGDLKKTIFKKAYNDELLRMYMDNINFLYVAFTRAESVLIGYCKKSDAPLKKLQDDGIKNTGTMLFAGFSANEDFGDVDMQADDHIEMGSIGSIPENREENDDFNVTGVPELISVDSISPMEKLATFPLRVDNDISKKAEWGSRMHRVMEKAITVDDIEPQLEEMMFKGYIDKAEYEKMLAQLTSYATNPAVAEWFDGKKRVIAERPVIEVYRDAAGNMEKREKRPDRVLIADDGSVTIIDYKFGENKEKSHIRQVERYIKLYKEAGHKNVTGYLYYFEGLEVIPIDV